MRIRWLLVIGLGMTLAAPLVVRAQAAAPAPPPAAAFPDQKTPAAIKVGDLKAAGWLMFNSDVLIQQENGDYHIIKDYTTRGDVCVLAGTPYLTAYQLGSPGVSADKTEVPGIFAADGPMIVPMPLPVTEDTPLTLCLLNLQNFGSLNDMVPYSQAWLDDLNIRLGTDPASLARMRRLIPEDTLAENVQQLRNAIERFQEDTGVYPVRLEDLVATTAPTVGTGGAAIPAGSYKGPYLDYKNGINNTVLPVNPFAKAGDPDIAHHWIYRPENGTVCSAVDGVTVNGEHFRNL